MAHASECKLYLECYCLPTVPGLPLWGTETSVRRRFCWAALGQAAACQYLLMWDVGRKEQWWVEKLRADLAWSGSVAGLNKANKAQIAKDCR
jgi:hypothetical protein